MAQTLIVVLLVLACAMHASWTLAPAAVRRALARTLLALPLPRAVAERLRRHADASGAGCSCDGCDHAPSKKKAAPAAVAPITFHRRLPR